MVTIHNIDNILQNEFVHFNYDKQFLTAEETFTLQKISGKRFYFENDPDSIEFNAFLKNCYYYFAQKKYLYFIYLEPYLALKSKIRSYQKLFYSLRKEIGEENVFELEIPVGLNESRMAAIVWVNRQNLDFVSTRLINSSFAFGYVTEENILADAKTSQTFLEVLVKRALNPDKHTSINLLKSIDQLIYPKNMLFRLGIDGKDNQYIEFFGVPAHLNQLLSLLEETVGTHFYLRKMQTDVL